MNDRPPVMVRFFVLFVNFQLNAQEVYRLKIHEIHEDKIWSVASFYFFWL